MEKLPSYFNDFWDFLIVPLLQFIIIIGLFYYMIDKPEFKNRLIETLKNVPEKLKWIRVKIFLPLGITAIASLSVIIIFISAIVILFRVNNVIGEFTPGNIGWNNNAALIHCTSDYELARIWATHPELEDITSLNLYISSVVYKEAPSYPELNNMLKAAKNNIDSVTISRQFEKVLVLYIILIIPLTLKKAKIKSKNIIRKSIALLFLVLLILLANVYNTYEAVKNSTQENFIAANMILAKDYKKVSNDSLHVFMQKVDDYKRLTANDYILIPDFNWPFNF